MVFIIANDAKWSGLYKKMGRKYHDDVRRIFSIFRPNAKTLVRERNKMLPEIQNNTRDYVTAAAKSVLGIIPFAGSLLAEVAGSIIPNQRVDRIAAFATALQQRIDHFEQAAIRLQLQDEVFTDLLEESLRQAARSTSDDRRDYLAAAIANSLGPDAIKNSESKHLLRIIGELSDIEIIWLRFYQDPWDHQDAFREKHSEVLQRKIAFIGCSQEELDEYALQQSYLKHLVDLGLVTPHISRDRNRMPEFDSFTGEFKISFHQTSALGDLLLRTIGISRKKDPSAPKIEIKAQEPV